eukprot:scaffold25271_cov86-Skeletonema_dohrnii-CCMP3373.AAC.2
MPPVHPTLKGNKWVLYPSNHHVQQWDTMFLIILVYYAFAIPYMIGVSGGYHMIHQTGWLVVNLIINGIYIIDTFMQFFRAYYDDEGMLVYELKKIARNYGCSRQFILNLISCFPTQALLYGLDRMVFRTESGVSDESFLFFTIIDMIKLLRLTRVTSLTKSTCFWAFVAFAQAHTYDFTKEGVPPTWISAWYESSYFPGSIDPIGWSNDVDRYALSLFWAIQSVTSIGYGVFWAYAIGNIIQILDHVHSSEVLYKVKMDSANSLINCFAPTDNPSREPDYGVGDSEMLATRIRRFLTSQYHKTARLDLSSEFNSKKLEEVYPMIEHLSPELRQLSSLHLLRAFLEKIPYLSSKYLSPDEQSEVAFKCVFIEFGRGETFYEHQKYERGIMILKNGFCMASRKSKHGHKRWYTRGNPIGISDVLVDADCLGRDERRRLLFYSYCLALYIPRSVILDVLKKKPRIWKDCARWCYLRACLLKWAREISGKRLNSDMYEIP